MKSFFLLAALFSSTILTSLQTFALRTIEIETSATENKYMQEKFKVKAGEDVQIILKNNSPAMPHNLVILQKGSDTMKIGALGIEAGNAKSWVPQSPAVLFASRLANGNQTVKLKFKAPKEKGEYPYICTFPGHYMTMKGIMIIE